jgi:SprT protein
MIGSTLAGSSFTNAAYFKRVTFILPIPESIKYQCESSLQALFGLACGKVEKLGLRRIKSTLICPTLLFNQRGKIAGSALLQKNIIKLHPKLLIDNLDYYLDEVIAHELAHILVYQLYGHSRGLLRLRKVKPHGQEWQMIMNDIFCLAPRVTHQLDVSKVAMQSFDYACHCKDIQLSLIRHNKVLKGKQSYYCRECRQPLLQKI